MRLYCFPLTDHCLSLKQMPVNRPTLPHDDDFLQRSMVIQLTQNNSFTAILFSGIALKESRLNFLTKFELYQAALTIALN